MAEVPRYRHDIGLDLRNIFVFIFGFFFLFVKEYTIQFPDNELVQRKIVD